MKPKYVIEQHRGVFIALRYTCGGRSGDYASLTDEPVKHATVEGAQREIDEHHAYWNAPRVLRPYDPETKTLGGVL